MELKKRFLLSTILLINVQIIFAQLFGDPQLVFEDNDYNFSLSSDVDNDNDYDLIQVNSNLIKWYPNTDGLGSWGEPEVIDTDTGQSFYQLVVDLDQDNRLDLLVSFFDNDFFGWYRNTGNGNFAPMQLLAPGVNRARDMDTGDIDGDGDLDLALGVSNGTGFYWIEHLDGQGNFGPLQLIDASLSQARSPKLGDIDGDGDLDVLINSVGSTYLSWYENLDGQGTFGNPRIIDVEGTMYQNSLELIDLDSDNDLDIIALSGDYAHLFKNTDGSGTFERGQILAFVPSSAFAIGGLQVVDLNNDNHPDVAYTSINGQTYNLNIDGQGNFSPPQIVPRPEGAVSGGWKVSIDMDSDGDLDLLSEIRFTDPTNRIDLYLYENLTILGQNDLAVQGLELSPNPVKDLLEIRSHSPLSKITIYNLFGQNVGSFVEATNLLDLSYLPSGIYLLELSGPEGVAFRKVVKR